MRRLSDALPTLADAASAADPRLALPAHSRGAKPDDAFDVASLRASLLKQKSDAAGTPAKPVNAARPNPLLRDKAAPAIPSLDAPRERVEDRTGAAVAAARVGFEKEKAEALELARKVERDIAARALDEARAGWVRDEAEALAGKFGEAFDALHARLSDAFGHVLAPLVEDSVREVAVRRFAAVLDELVGPAADGPALTVRGPVDLVEALKRSLGRAGGVALVVADTPDLVVELDDTRLETTVGAFAETLVATVGPRSCPVPRLHAATPAPAAPVAAAPPEESTDV